MNSIDSTRPLNALKLPDDSTVQVSALDYAKTKQDCLRPNAVDRATEVVPNASLMARFLQGKGRSNHTIAAPAPSQCSPWLESLVYPLGRYVVAPFYFSHVEVTGREYLPSSGPIIFAPTHRSRWDAVMVPYAVGHDVTGRHLRFMVSADEVKGLQGWFIQHLGGFPIDTRRPAIASLRHGVELLQNGESLVIFPEGNIFRETEIQRLKPGLARLALQAEASHPNLGIKVVPIHLHYSQPLVPWRCQLRICIGQPLQVSHYKLNAPKQSAQSLTADLKQAMEAL